MKKPVYEYVDCPDCGETAFISLLNAGYYFLADAVWRCPYCKETHDTATLQDAQEKK